MCKKIALLLVLAGVIFSLLTAFANSAEPPSIIILVQTDDAANLDIRLADIGARPAQVITRFYQVQYNFYRHEIKVDDIIKFDVSYGDRQFQVEAKPITEYSYRNIYTLDLKNEVLKEDVSPVLQATLIGSRVILTLLIEGAILFLFGFRRRKTWLYFLLINLATQGFLNISLSRAPIFYVAYFWIGALIYECLILLIEMTAFLLLVEESSKIKQFFYVLISNIVSFIVGGYLIMLLPI